MKAEYFFSETDKKRIEETIHSVETATAGEIAVALVDMSDSYPEARILGGTLIGSFCSLLIADFFFEGSLWVFLPCALALTVLMGWLIRFVPVLHRFFVVPARLEKKVEEGAVRAFYDKELYKTRDETGVLFFLSLFEHKVWVLADKGIYEKISQEDLQQYAHSIAAGVRKGQAAEALCQAIEDVGQVLALHFPIQPDDTNELSNKVIIGSKETV